MGGKVKVSSERIENSQVVLQVEAEPEEVERSLEEAYRHLVKRADVPGFRKGKAPRAMLERYLGKEALLNEAVERLVPQLYSRAVEEQGIDAIAQPEIEITQTDPVIFKATVPLRPTVELGNYREIRVDPEPVEVAEEEVEKVIEQIRYQHAPWQPAERPIQFGDLVTIDVKGSLEDGSLLDRKDLQYQVLKALPFPVPGFSEQLEGLEKGEEKEFTISFPADYEISHLAGKEYPFRVVVSEIKEKKLPELNDEFAKSLGEGFEDLESLRQRIASNLKAMAEERERRRLEEKVIEAVVELSKVDFPPVLVEWEIDRLIREKEASLEERIKSRGKSGEELREELRPLATRRATVYLVLGKVAEEEKIEVAEAEIEEEVEAIAQEAGERGEELRKFFHSAARQSLEEALLTRKTVKRLVEIASGDEPEIMAEKGGGDGS
ncbi:MAG: trigger factor [Dehalococcoidia bacterium]|nr:MAG: trigger factor [Dehalococcoidia bacterium]